MELLKRIKDRSPEYDAKYYDMILDFTIEQGAGMGRQSEQDRWKQGKYFSTRYEIYMYAALLGMKRDYRIPIPRGTKKEHFIPIESWRPNEVADYVIMALLGKVDIDLNALEHMEEEEVEEKITELRGHLESYANGGLDIIRGKRDEDPAYFQQNDNCFIDLLG